MKRAVPYEALKTDYITEAEYHLLNTQCKDIRVKLIHSINTVKATQKQS